jgi:hypothetical protein
MENADEPSSTPATAHEHDGAAADSPGQDAGPGGGDGAPAAEAPALSGTVTLWMSFSDPARPPGQQFLGVCLIDVTEVEAHAAIPHMRALYPHAKEGAEWLFVAQRALWLLEINPGGAVGSFAQPVDFSPWKDVPRLRLMSRAELKERGLIE